MNEKLNPKDINYWLQEGKQSKIGKISDIVKDFSGSSFDKVVLILEWLSKNIKTQRNHEEVLKIFATRTAEEIIKDKFSTGCHDDAVLFVVLCRALKIPAKYIAGIDKKYPQNRGHCVAEVFINNKWVMVDSSRQTINLEFRKSSFSHSNFVVGEGLDSWDVGIKGFDDWKEKSKEVIEKYKDQIESLQDNVKKD